jgi:hypothetical protein
MIKGSKLRLKAIEPRMAPKTLRELIFMLNLSYLRPQLQLSKKSAKKMIRIILLRIVYNRTFLNFSREKIKHTVDESFPKAEM